MSGRAVAALRVNPEVITTSLPSSLDSGSNFFVGCGSYNPSQVAWVLPRIEGIAGSNRGGWDRVAVWGCEQVGLGGLGVVS